MCHRYCIEAVDRSLRDIARRNVPFGGKCVLFSADFLQILPVIPEGSRTQIVHGCVKSSALHAGFRVLRLTENMRLSSLRNDPKASETALLFPSCLLRLGEGRLEESETNMVELPQAVQNFSKRRCSMRLCLRWIGVASHGRALAYFKGYSAYEKFQAD